jgi:hypothetical protein
LSTAAQLKSKKAGAGANILCARGLHSANPAPLYAVNPSFSRNIYT